MFVLQLIATAALFLASKYEETPRPLDDVLRVSCENFYGQDFHILSYMLPIVSITSSRLPNALGMLVCLSVCFNRKISNA